jgi:hypothetical protein
MCSLSLALALSIHNKLPCRNFGQSLCNAGYLQRIAGNVSPQSFLFSTLSISLCTWTVQSGFVPHVTFLVQKLLGEMEKCGKEKTSGGHVSCNLLYYSHRFVYAASHASTSLF